MLKVFREVRPDAQSDIAETRQYLWFHRTVYGRVAKILHQQEEYFIAIWYNL